MPEILNSVSRFVNDAFESLTLKMIGDVKVVLDMSSSSRVIVTQYLCLSFGPAFILLTVRLFVEKVRLAFLLKDSGFDCRSIRSSSA